ncbi:MAG: aminotransferase class III-fold pyridoxal phosphate-dependent enzyme, partial [Cyclobacteriaceae bacterium]|nr:aminotransferase class III-fold pyridoxal phosphate-dependent enzyme [Cyclobacteriaceae bacterium]
MKQFDVYPRYAIDLDRGEGCLVYDTAGQSYLDLYGGHAVISIGHSHPHYVKRISEQLAKIGFYSNSVNLAIQDELAAKLGEACGLPDYDLFLCNSGAEANENALKLASFQTGRKKFIVFENGFHGRTSLAVEATDNSKIQAPVNHTGNIIRLPFNDLEAVKKAMSNEIAGILVEGIQGIGGICLPSNEFLIGLRDLCQQYDAMLILDEIQSGYGRTGDFFSFEPAGIRPDIITLAKGMGNGFPIGGVLIAPHISAWPGMLGTTFGGNPLACAAALAVLEVMKEENLLQHTKTTGTYLIDELGKIPGLADVRGRGLMIGIDLPGSAKDLRAALLNTYQIFTGS